MKGIQERLQKMKSTEQDSANCMRKLCNRNQTFAKKKLDLEFKVEEARKEEARVQEPNAVHVKEYKEKAAIIFEKVRRSIQAKRRGCKGKHRKAATKRSNH